MTASVVAVMVFAISSGLCCTFLRGPKSRLLDHPNDRSLHVVPVPRTGGIAVMIAIALAEVFGAGRELVLCGLALALAAISLCDDIAGVPIVVRLLAHLAAAGAAAAWAIGDGGLVLVLAATLALAWGTNLYNFMDGMNGLAAAMTIVGFGTYALLAADRGASQLALFCAVVACAIVGFLRFNFPVARMFLGDVGSIPLGFLAGAVGLVGWRRDLWPAWLPAVVFAPFLVDGTVTLIRRAARRERVWQAHRQHYYQRAVQMGWGYPRVLLVETAVMLISAAAAVAAMNATIVVSVALASTLALIVLSLMVAIDSGWRQFEPRRVVRIDSTIASAGR